MPLGREHVVPGNEFDVSGYIALAGQSPGVQEMIERLKTNRPAGAADSAENVGLDHLCRLSFNKSSRLQRAITYMMVDSPPSF